MGLIMLGSQSQRFAQREEQKVVKKQLLIQQIAQLLHWSPQLTAVMA
jgi:hypothetical protein